MTERSPRILLGLHDLVRWCVCAPALWVGLGGLMAMLSALAVRELAGALLVAGAFDGGLLVPSLWFGGIVFALWCLYFVLSVALRRESRRAKVAVKRLMWWAFVGVGGGTAAWYMRREADYGDTPLTTLAVLAMVASGVLALALTAAVTTAALDAVRSRARRGRWGALTATVYGLGTAALALVAALALALSAPAAPAYAVVLASAWQSPAAAPQATAERLERLGHDDHEARRFTAEELGLELPEASDAQALLVDAREKVLRRADMVLAPADAQPQETSEEGEGTPSTDEVAPAAPSEVATRRLRRRPPPLDVVVWNTNAGPFGDRDGQLPFIAESIGAWAEDGVGLFLLQEVEPDWIDRIQSELGPGFGRIQSRSGRMMRVVIFFDTARLTLRGWDELTSVVDGSTARRAPIAARFWVDDLRPLEVMNVHLTRGSVEEDGERRVEEARRLGALTRRGDDPLLILGDFNADCRLEAEVEACHPTLPALLDVGGEWVRPERAISTTCSERYDTMLDLVVAMRGAEQGAHRVEILEGYCDDMASGAHRPLRVRADMSAIAPARTTP